MRDELTIRVPTSQLRKLLEDQPEIALKLESFAVEKIGEEILAKIMKRGPSLEQEVAERAEAVIKRQLAEIGNRYRMPKEVRDAIADGVKSSVEYEIRTRFGKAEDEIKRLVKNRVDAAHDELKKATYDAAERFKVTIAQDMRETIFAYAEEAFFDVLRRAKEGVA